jgi:exocyst complex component 2
MKNKTDVSIFISEKTFSPKIFLKEVHKNTDFKELEQGVIRLKQSIAERNETTKGLVKKHFAKFVNAKSIIDSKI